MAVLVGSRDNVVSISAIESLKMLALSVVWGSWIVIKNAVTRVFRPLWSNSGSRGNNKNVVTGAGGKAIRLATIRDRAPPCLSTTVYGTHSYVKVKGVKLHYVECGDPNGTIVLLLHGFPSCWISWHHQIPILSKYFRLVVNLVSSKLKGLAKKFELSNDSTIMGNFKDQKKV